jgi:hypothetical protein
MKQTKIWRDLWMAVVASTDKCNDPADPYFVDFDVYQLMSLEPVQYVKDQHMLHFCGRQQSMNLGVLMDRLYSLAAEMMPAHWDAECAE